MPENISPTNPVTVTTTSVTKLVSTNWFYQLVDTLSLSGAITFLFFSLTFYGIVQKEEKVWSTFGTALTTFVSGRQLGRQEDIKRK